MKRTVGKKTKLFTIAVALIVVLSAVYMVIRNTAEIELSNLGYLKPNHVSEETGERSLSFGGNTEFRFL